MALGHRGLGGSAGVQRWLPSEQPPARASPQAAELVGLPLSPCGHSMLPKLRGVPGAPARSSGSHRPEARWLAAGAPGSRPQHRAAF